MRRSIAALKSASRVPTLQLGFVRCFSTASATPPNLKYVRVEHKGPVVWVTLTRAERHNAFNEDVIGEISQAFTYVTDTVNKGSNKVADGSDSLPRAAVLTGDGPSFSAGADLSWMKKMAQYSEAENKADSERLFDMFNAIYSCPIPTIARVNGSALGGGSGLVAACDIGVAVNKATLGFTEVQLGLIPAVISRFCLEKIGIANAKRYFLTGERFNGADAVKMGLVQSSYESIEEVDKAVEAILKNITSASPNAVRNAKVLIRDVIEQDLTIGKSETRTILASKIAGLRVSAEGQAGLNAFLNKQSVPWLIKENK